MTPQLIKGKSIDECVRCGHWSAKVVIQHSGCTFPAKCDFA
jgi:adenosine kinase